MSRTSTLKGQCITKFLGTGLLILFGVGCVAALRVADASFGQWGINAIWRLGVTMAVCLTVGVFGARLNPAVTIALWLLACLGKRKVIPFIVSQIAGVFCAAVLVYGLYYNLLFDSEQTRHIVHGSVESIDLAGTFSAYPNPHVSFMQAFTVEMVITAILMGLVLALTGDGDGVSRGPLAPLLIDLPVTVIGTSMGPLTGFAMNPARDFDPKVFAWLAGWGNVTFTGGRGIPYFPVPLFGPIIGAIVDASAYRKLIGRHSPCDICIVGEKEIATPSRQRASL